jgi:hypothetical protein
MTRWFGSLCLGALVVLPLSFGVPARAADHRDAPTIDDYAAIDINDVFMFRDPPCTVANCASQNLVMVLSTQAVADPSFGLSYHFQPNALYRFNFSTTPTAIAKGLPTASIDFIFSPFDNNSACPAPSPPCQTYQAFFPRDIVIDGLTTQGSAAATPNPVVVTEDGPISVFAGPREDPFFFDLVGFNRFIADFNGQTTTPAVPHFNLFTGKDAFLGKNINAIVVEFPIKMLLPPGSTKLAAWAVTYLGGLPDDDFDQHNRGEHRRPHDDDLRQLDRMGNPGVNTVLISTPLKDAFNFGLPQNDAHDFAPTIAGNLIRYGVDQTNVLPVLKTAAVPDTLKFDTKLADGYLQVPPNGRQLVDRTTDFLLTLFFNVQGPPGTQHPGNVTCPGLAQTAFSDCTAPKVSLTAFPFVGPPLQPTP